MTQEELLNLTVEQKTDLLRQLFKVNPDMENHPALLKIYEKYGEEITEQFKKQIHEPNN